MTVTWNGSIITGPVLIYVDEIIVNDYRTVVIGEPNRPGALVCRSEDKARVTWYFTDSNIVSVAPRNNERGYIQTRTGENVIPSLSRLSLGREGISNDEAHLNGLWFCRLNADGSSIRMYVGIFSRGQSKQASFIEFLL